MLTILLKPGLHKVVMVVSTVASMFLTLSQAIMIHVNTLIATSQALLALESIDLSRVA